MQRRLARAIGKPGRDGGKCFALKRFGEERFDGQRPACMPGRRVS
jgi:hypothetical protein